MKVGIVYGGTSTEREASALNARAVEASLRGRGYGAAMIPYDQELLENLRREKPDMVFLCVQGKGHGDGTLQGMLDFLGIPYTGSGMTAAAVINDKLLCKALFERYGHRTPRWTALSGRDWRAGAIPVEAVGYPFVAKAPTQGGSFGIALIRSEAELDRIGVAFRYDDPVLLESFVQGSFYTVGVLERDGEAIALPCVEGVDEREERGELRLFTGRFGAVRARLPESRQAEMQSTALSVFRELGARDYARVDFMIGAEDGLAQLLEINAVPGLKPASLLPLAAGLAGIGYNDLIEGVLQSALRRERQCFGT